MGFSVLIPLGLNYGACTRACGLNPKAIIDCMNKISEKGPLSAADEVEMLSYLDF